MKNYKYLKSGSDVRGCAIEGIDSEPITLTDEAIYDITRAFYYWLNKRIKKDNIKIAVGHDSRLSAKKIEKIVADALVKSGANVILTHLSTTPAMFMTTRLISTDAAIEITASHLPFNKNGLKFFTKDGGLESKDIEEILSYAESDKCITGVGSLKEYDFMGDYAKHLVNIVREKTNEEKPLQGLKIIVDAGNGAGGFYANDVLKKLGADTSGSQFLNPDGSFPNHIPNPENKDAMKSIQSKVKEVGADFGIIFDTDVDRAGAVDDLASEINRNSLIALISAILLEERKGGIIVTDSLTSDGLTKFIESRGGIHHRYKRGYKNVIDESIRLNNEGKYSPLAIETSGHAALIENYFLDDGAYLITRILIKMAELKKRNKKIRDLISDLEQPLEQVEIRMKFRANIDFLSYGNKILDDLLIYAKNNNMILPQKNYEGVRINFDKNSGDGWLLLRMSLHDPIMPLNIESNIKGGIKIMAKKLYDFLINYEYINLDNLNKILE